MNGVSPVSKVTVTASEENGNLAVKVSPWRAPVFHEVPLFVEFNGPPGNSMKMRLEAKNATQWGSVAQPLPPQAVFSGGHIPVSVRKGPLNTRGAYNIILDMGNSDEIRIDPEIFICK
jgi:hypothetical protein